MNEINTTPTTFFSVQENSNYEVLMSHGRSEVISFKQFQKLMTFLNKVEVQFVTVNQRVVKISTIIDISPTDKPLKAKKQNAKPVDEAEYWKDFDLFLKDLKK